RRRRAPVERLRGQPMTHLRLARRSFLTAAVATLAAPARAATQISLVGATLWRPGAPALENAVITLDDGKIAAIGGPPAGATIDAKDKIVTAGFTDLLTQIGIVEVDLERSTRDAEH